MKKKLLLPPFTKVIGAILAIPSVVLGFVALLDFNSSQSSAFLSFIESVNDFLYRSTNMTILLILIISSLMMLALSSEKDEDECIASIRARCLLLSIWIVGLLNILAALFLDGFDYLHFVFVNLILYLITFIVIFKYNLYKFRNQNKE